MLRKSGLGLALVSALALTSASQAFADGMPGGSLKDEPVPMAPVYDWNGLSVGIGIGASTFSPNVDAGGNRRHDKRYCKDYNPYSQYYPIEIVLPNYNHIWCETFDFDNDTRLGGGTQTSSDDWDWFGTVQVGYDRLITDHILIGAFADFDFYRDSEHTFAEFIDREGYSRDVHLEGRLEREHIWSVGARLGFLITPRVLLYGLAAYSRMSLDGSFAIDFNSPGDYYPNPDPLHVKLNKDVDGYTLGAGVEMKLEKRLSLKIEYRYMSFDGTSAENVERTDGHFYDCGYNCFSQKATRVAAQMSVDDMDEHSVRAVLSWKLSRDEDHVPLK